MSPSSTSSLHVPRPWYVTLIAVLCSGYTVGMLAFVASRILPGRAPFLALADTFAPFLFAPLLLVLPVAWLVRSKTALIGALAVLGVFLVMYGPFFTPSLRPVPVHANDALTVMTFNLGYDQSHPERLVLAIAEEDADVVAVQEIEPSTAALVRQELGKRYPHMILDPSVGSTGLLSRHPILESRWFQPAGEGPPALYALVDVDGTAVHVLAVHPLRPGVTWYKETWLLTGLYDRGTQRQVIDVAQRAGDLEGPVLVMGDLNLSDQTRAYARLSQVLKDTWREVGWGFGLTFPRFLIVGPTRVPGPWVRIDYIFHSSDVGAERARVACHGGSDHCYLVARLALQRLNDVPLDDASR